MNALWALIQSGVVVNMVWALTTDYQNPAYTWVDVTSLSPQPGVGWTYDGSTFSPPPIPPIDWSSILQGDIDAIQSSYLQALSDYQAAQVAGSQAAADAGVALGVSDSSPTYSTNEASTFEAMISLIQSGG